MKKIAAVNDLSGFGKCSLTAAIPVMSALGVQCCPLVTGVFSNQTGYDSFYCRDCTDDMVPCIEEWKKLGAEFVKQMQSAEIRGVDLSNKTFTLI